MKFVLFAFLFTLFAHAGDLKPESKFFVKSVDGSDVKSLAAPNVKVLPPHRKVANDSYLPSVADRDRIFQESGLLSQLKDWDDFEKDALYLKLQKKGPMTIDRLVVKYPDLKRENLEAAQKIITKEE